MIKYDIDMIKYDKYDIFALEPWRHSRKAKYPSDDEIKSPTPHLITVSVVQV